MAIDLHKLPGEVSGTQHHHERQVSIAAGGQVSIETPQVSVNKTQRLLAFLVSSSVPVKCEVKTVQDNIDTIVMVGFERLWYWQTPDPDLFTQSYTDTPGLDGFRLTITNLDTDRPADVYATIMFDEVPK